MRWGELGKIDDIGKGTETVVVPTIGVLPVSIWAAAMLGGNTLWMVFR